MIDAGEWLTSRRPAAPVELTQRLAQIINGKTCADETDLARLFVHEATLLLASLADDRSAALDLLVADSLLTYAMEASAEQCVDVEAIALETMLLVSAVASREGHS